MNPVLDSHLSICNQNGGMPISFSMQLIQLSKTIIKFLTYFAVKTIIKFLIYSIVDFYNIFLNLLIISTRIYSYLIILAIYPDKSYNVLSEWLGNKDLASRIIGLSYLLNDNLFKR